MIKFLQNQWQREVQLHMLKTEKKEYERENNKLLCLLYKYYCWPKESIKDIVQPKYEFCTNMKFICCNPLKVQIFLFVLPHSILNYINFKLTLTSVLHTKKMEIYKSMLK